MKTVALITAMESEFNAVYALYNFTKQNENMAKAIVNNTTILLIKSGIGKVNAALAAVKAIQNKADLIITTGLAGGIDGLLNQGDIVLADKVCYHDVWCGTPNAQGQVQDFPLYFETPADIIDKLKKQLPQGYLKYGLTVTGDQFLTDVNRLTEIKKGFPNALAVDMESAAIAQTCFIYNTAFISLRIISDVVGKVGQKEQYESFWQNMPQKASQMVDIVLKTLIS